MKGYTVFNVEQIDGLLEHYYAKPVPRGRRASRGLAANYHNSKKRIAS
jgi:antirestriction protein ArdC